jgi:hypothetical protein
MLSQNFRNFLKHGLKAYIGISATLGLFLLSYLAFSFVSWQMSAPFLFESKEKAIFYLGTISMTISIFLCLRLYHLNTMNKKSAQTWGVKIFLYIVSLIGTGYIFLILLNI